MATYLPDVTNVFLSARAKALPVADLEAYADLAEDLLGIVGVEFLDDDEVTLERAVALQISVLIEYDTNAVWLESRGLGPLSWKYRDGAPVHPVAVNLVGRAKDRLSDATTPTGRSEYTSLRSIRGRTFIPPGG